MFSVYPVGGGSRGKRDELDECVEKRFFAFLVEDRQALCYYYILKK
jgi:hypothetical protein